jgi:hypothetical protein
MTDNLVKCPHCEAEMCYEYHNPHFIQWMCFNCGYGSTSHMVKDSDFVKSSKEVLPELIKDLEFTDENDFIWYPSTINVPEKGILFPNGNNKDNWMWAVAPLTLIKKEEKSRFPKKQTHKVDLNNMQYFPREEFARAVTTLNEL